MIHVHREPAPAYLALAKVARWHIDLCDKRARYYRDLSAYKRKLSAFQNGMLSQKPNPPLRPSADSNHYGHEDVRNVLRTMFGSKCAYCEAEVAAVSPQHVEHYRPAARYPGLAYQWENLLLACPHCNSTHKRDQFPIAPKGQTLEEHRRNPCSRPNVGETPLLLNPCTDSPEQHLTFRDGRVVALSNRAKRTRDICGLNRDDLVATRRQWLRLIQRSAEEYRIAELEGDIARRDRYASDLKLFIDVTTRFTAMARAELDLQGIDWRSW